MRDCTDDQNRMSSVESEKATWLGSGEEGLDLRLAETRDEGRRARLGWTNKELQQWGSSACRPADIIPARPRSRPGSFGASRFRPGEFPKRAEALGIDHVCVPNG